MELQRKYEGEAKAAKREHDELVQQLRRQLGELQTATTLKAESLSQQLSSKCCTSPTSLHNVTYLYFRVAGREAGGGRRPAGPKEGPVGRPGPRRGAQGRRCPVQTHQRQQRGAQQGSGDQDPEADDGPGQGELRARRTARGVDEFFFNQRCVYWLASQKIANETARTEEKHGDLKATQESLNQANREIVALRASLSTEAAIKDQLRVKENAQAEDIRKLSEHIDMKNAIVRKQVCTSLR